MSEIPELREEYAAEFRRLMAEVDPDVPDPDVVAEAMMGVAARQAIRGELGT